jgi:pimeloyl-ACP methyl ester carboxylesterase
VKKVIFAHGLEAGPVGTKSIALQAAGLDPIVPDGRGKQLAARIADLEAILDEHPDAVLTGSSYGALAALAVVDRGRRPSALVLVAPALILREDPVSSPGALCVPAGIPCVVLHGTRDRVVPIDASRSHLARSPHVRLVEVDDDHRLSASTGIFVREVLELASR